MKREETEMDGIQLPDLMDTLMISKIDTVLLTRHQATGIEENKEALLRYVLQEIDPPLSAAGRAAAEMLQGSLMEKVSGPFVAVCSPKKRTIQTRDLILGPNQPYQTYSSIDLEPPNYRVIPEEIRAWVYGKLSLLDTRRAWLRSEDFPVRLQKVTEAVKSFLGYYKCTTVFVVTHSEIADLLMCLLTGATPYRFVEPEYHASTVVVLKRTLGEGPHQYFSKAA